jgi:hypothetical protein
MKIIYKETPLQGLSSGTTEQGKFYKFTVINPPRGRPFRGGGIHHIGSMRFILIRIPDGNYCHRKT